jgi:hypothetical protein
MTQPASQCGERRQLGHVFGTATRTRPPLAARNRTPRPCDTTIPGQHVRRSEGILLVIAEGVEFEPTRTRQRPSGFKTRQ